MPCKKRANTIAERTKWIENKWMRSNISCNDLTSEHTRALLNILPVPVRMYQKATQIAQIVECFTVIKSLEILSKCSPFIGGETTPFINLLTKVLDILTFGFFWYVLTWSDGNVEIACAYYGICLYLKEYINRILTGQDKTCPVKLLPKLYVEFFAQFVGISSPALIPIGDKRKHNKNVERQKDASPYESTRLQVHTTAEFFRHCAHDDL